MPKAQIRRAIWLRHVALHGPFCTYCGVSIAWGVQNDQCATIDHVLARALGGFGMLHNIVVCCLRCNRLKADFEDRMVRELGALFPPRKPAPAGRARDLRKVS